MMFKIILIHLFLFCILFLLQVFFIVVISLTIIGPKTSALIALGTLISLLTSYIFTRLVVKKILK
jgi:hypothetical protein